MNLKNLVKKEIKEDISKILENPLLNFPSIEKAIELSKKFKIPLHPQYLFYWNELSSSNLVFFLEYFIKNFSICDKNLHILSNTKIKKYLELIGCEHSFEENKIILDELNKKILLSNLGILNFENLNEENIKEKITNMIEFIKNNLDKNISFLLTKRNEIKIKDKGGTYIGCRMGRPEKSKMRKQFLEEVNSQLLFPLGEEGGRNKNFFTALKEKSFITSNFRMFFCKECNRKSIFKFCEKCKKKTSQMFFSRQTKSQINNYYVKTTISDMLNIIENFSKYQKNLEEHKNFLKEILNELESLDSNDFLQVKKFEKVKRVCEIFSESINLNPNLNEEINSQILSRIREISRAVYFDNYKLDLKDIEKSIRDIFPQGFEFEKVLKGVGKIVNEHSTIEHPIKGLLRMKNKVYVNKDGTIRYDMTEMGVSHFKPKEIGTSLEKLKSLGYKKDYLGNELTTENQILEIFPQDVILPDCPNTDDENCSEFIINVGNYVDELLQKFYKEKPFYNFKNKEDTIGHLIIGLAPHTSAGIIGRIIGYSKTQGCFSHPMWHAAQRRNLDGDENGIMLLLDGLINFSRDYLPNRRGTKTMDVPLVLTLHLYLDQVDDEIHDMDTMRFYPLNFYEACENYSYPYEVKMEQFSKRLDFENEDDIYFKTFFTHQSENFNNTVLCSSYKSLPTMKDKLKHQLKLCRKIRAVNENEVGSLIIDRHFMRDIKGNLRKFSQQNFRCTNCNESYRRPPLNGKCYKCKKPSINFTVHEASVKKYMIPSFEIIKNYKVRSYVKESIDLVNIRIENVFGKEVNDVSLKKFF